MEVEKCLLLLESSENEAHGNVSKRTNLRIHSERTNRCIAWRNRCRIGLSKDLWLFKAHWTMLQWFIHLAELADVRFIPGSMSARIPWVLSKIPWMPSTKKTPIWDSKEKTRLVPKKMCRAPVPTSFLGDSGGQIYCKLFASQTHQFSSSMAKHGCLLTSKKKKLRRAREENRSWWVLQTSHLEAWQAEKMSVTFV